MLLQEWDWDVAKVVWEREATEKGVEQGIEQGMDETFAVIGLAMQGKTAKQIARKLKISIKRVEDMLSKWKGLTEKAM